ncbi:hypothetical protein [Hydrogenophaga intermedia]|uniref:Uncharacterized protein n=1 Tax=Hydrogenophaga intermedia TaxID=65786 RepID=A0A1L1PBU3_HYDIT|nr:hypothetical protein [Hydrogenophaga intermedia]TMU72431.1 hypothetical protein FGJ01_18835 [Hydrogenophaga intermedia]CDN87492.1 hypothetical protein BN948_01914 [Hydrogenophaga intermedia]
MWEEWFQNVSSSLLNKAADAKFTQPYELQKLRLQALGELGLYNEGQPQTVAPQTMFGMSPGVVVLLALGAVVAVFALKD